jgi:WD40 repeat protein
VVDVTLAGDNNTALSASADGNLILWDLDSGEVQKIFSAHPGGACCVEMLPDGVHALSGGADGALLLWDLDSGAIGQRLQTPGGAVVAMAVSADGTNAIAALEDHSLILYAITEQGDLSQRHVVAGHPSVVEAYTEAGAFIPGHYGAIRGVAFSPDGSLFLSVANDEWLMVGDVASGRITGSYDMDIRLESLAVSADNQVLVGTADNRLVRFDLESREETQVLLGHTSRVEALAFSPDGQHVLSGANDGDLRLWHIHNGAELRIIDKDVWGYPSLALSPTGDRILAGLWYGGIHLIDYETGKRICMLTGHKSMVFGGIRFLPDGRRAVSADGDLLNFTPTTTLRLWDLDTCEQIAVLAGERLPAWDLDVSADGRFAVYGANDGVHLWDLQTGEARLLLNIAPQNARSVAYSPDGRSVLVGPGKGVSENPDYSLILVDLESGQEVRRFPGHHEAVTDLAFNADGRQVLSGSFGGELFLWDTNNGALLHEFREHTSAVLAATFSPDGRLIASADQSGTIFIWDAVSGNALRHLNGQTRQVLDLAFHPNGQFLLSASDDDTLREWRIDVDDSGLLDWVSTNRYVPTLTNEQRARYNIVPATEHVHEG